MRRTLGITLLGLFLSLRPGAAEAQGAGRNTLLPAVDYSRRTYAAPGFFGTTYGSASFGLARTYSSFASPYGLGYGYGYAPYRILPGSHGAGIWTPGAVAPGYAYYGTFPVYPDVDRVLPGIGAYAPAFGPVPASIP